MHDSHSTSHNTIADLQRATTSARRAAHARLAATIVRGVPRPMLVAVPASLRPVLALEVAGTLLMGLAIATIEGGVISVFAKHTFAGKVDQSLLNLLVGLLAAAGELANILSFFWTSVAQGRPKRPIVVGQLAAVVACVATIAVLPSGSAGGAGLFALLACVIVARIAWSGYITLRPTLWRANYPTNVRTRVVGVLSSVQVVVSAIVGMSLSRLLDSNPEAFRVFLPCVCAAAVMGIVCFSRLPVRREGLLLASEREAGDAGRILRPWEGPLVVLRVLREDRWYAQFMLWMFVLGFANLMLTPTLVISLQEELQFSQFESVLVIHSIPSLVTILAIPLWRSLLERSHIVRFRAIHAWIFVVASAFFTVGAFVDQASWYFLGAICMGIGFGGGSLAWNLGHVDFARPSQTSKYMATHVTLNGIRGLLAPIAVATAYELLRAAGKDAHLIIQSAGFVLSVIGAGGFVHLKMKMGTLASQGSSRGTNAR